MKKDFKTFIGKAAVLCSVAALLGVGVSANANAKIPVELTKSMPWANSDKVTCKQISADGKVSSKSEKSVAWVMEYRESMDNGITKNHRKIGIDSLREQRYHP